MLNMLYGTSTDSVARKAAAQAQADVTAALSTMAGLGTLAQQDVITSSQILDPENLPSGGGEGVDTDENAITVVAGFTYRAFSAADGAFVFVADKDPVRGTNYTENVPLDCPFCTPESDTVLGLPATRSSDGATFSGPVLLNGSELAGVTSSSVLTLAFAVKLYGVTPDKLRVRIFDAAGANDYFGLDFDTATVEDAGAYNNTEIGSAVGQAGTEISGDLGTREYIVSVRMPVLTTIAGNIEIRLVAHNTSPGNADNDYAVAPIALYVDETYDYDATDGTEKFELATAGAGALLTMTTDANQDASIDGDNATLVLPAAPATDTVRVMALRVDIVNGGSLALPSSDVTIYGDAGPFDTEAVLAVRQYDDGTADIAVRGT